MPPAPPHIPRPVELLIGTESIGAFLGIGPDRARTLPAKGAPVFKRGKRGDLVAEKAELWAWHKENPDL